MVRIRRKRTAALKIKTMTEPKLNSKLRRPCRRDEPHPFISSLY
uniref:Shugoshin_C domain-containing protein n=1 Tax=Angiostrongylus cantonensis TaxID=6313 RepID=A0A0K0D9H6_ANGCA